MNRRVTFARLHQNIHLPGAGELGNTLPPSSKTLNNLVMTFVDAGLVVKFSYNRINSELLIPAANVAVASLAPEEAPVEDNSRYGFAPTLVANG